MDISETLGAQLEQYYDLKKATSLEELDAFDCIDRIDSYKENLDLNPSSPFGVYVLKEKESGEPVGIQGFSPRVISGTLVAEEMTDILSSQQGKGHGKLLRREAAIILNKFIGTVGLFKEQPEMPLAYLYSDNEWCWGQNHASLKTSISAGYGVVCITPGMGLAHMFFPSSHESIWNQTRIKHLLEASELLQTAFSAMAKEGESALSHLHKSLLQDKGEAITEHFMFILEDLDLDKCSDMCSFFSITTFLLENLNGLFNSNDRLTGYFKTLKKEHVIHLIALISSENKVDEILPEFLKDFCGFKNLQFYKTSHPGIFDRLNMLL